jgi:diguanylate cyclase (GGDEF)-like protein
MNLRDSRPLSLVVDDDPIFRSATVAALSRLGFRTAEAPDGHAALDRFRAEPADVVLLDAQMPGLDGFETCRSLRSMRGGEVVPVLMLTALEDEQSIARAYDAGATDFHSKPPRWLILAQRVRFMVRAARMREDLERSRAQSAHAQRVARLGHWEWDLHADRVEVSAECARLLGLAPVAAILEPRAFLECFHASDGALLAELGAFAKESVGEGSADPGPIEFECRIPVRPAPRIVRIEALLARGEDGRAGRVSAVVQDVTERRMAEERIRHLAHFDPLTGFLNRNRFRELVGESLGVGSAAVLVIDLRRLAQVNDIFGTAAGDSVLREAASRIGAGLGGVTDERPALRGTAGRPSGGEFAILLTGEVNAETAREVGERIVEELRAPFHVEGREIIVRASAGFAMHPEDAGDVDELLRKADHGLLVAKGGRPGTVSRCPPAPPERSADRLILETELHHALERRELVLHYQPQVDVRTGRVVSAEALMRWRREDRLIAPGVFLPLAEDSGLIESIEEWAILSACWQYRLWCEAGLAPVPVAVNITASHFLSPTLVGAVRTALAESGCPPAHLELEITETVLLQDLPHALPQIEALNALGVRISIDDFGTGYSSLSYLRSLPIDRLKIDRSFVSDLERSRDARVLVNAMIGMSKAMSLKVVAEGVETLEQAQCLVRNGCSVMQGFWFARPMPAPDLQALLAGARPPHWKMPRSRSEPAALELEERIHAA